MQEYNTCPEALIFNGGPDAELDLLQTRRHHHPPRVGRHASRRKAGGL